MDQVDVMAFSHLYHDGWMECPNKENGCKGRIYITHISKHIDRCRYGVSVCPYRYHMTCNWSGILESLHTHLSEGHEDKKAYLKTTFPAAIVLDNYNEKTHFLQAISSPFNLFFWVGHNDKDREKSYFLVQYVGPRTWSQRFRYSFTLKTSDGQQTLSEYQYTTSYMMDPYSLMNLGQCAIFYNSYVELCLSEAGTLTLELDVVFLDDRKMKMLFPDRV